MKVLLLVDVEKLGYLGDVVETNAGYARNYLLPQGLAVVPTEANLKSIAKEKAQRAEHRITERKRLEQACSKVQGAEAVLAAKANEQGVLFGSVSAGQIAANLREQGFEVADEVVHLVEHIKHIGTHTIELKFADDLTATVNVVVVKEGAELAEPKEALEPAEVPSVSKETPQEPTGEEPQATSTEEKAQPASAEEHPDSEEKPKEKKKRSWFGRKK
jgi:large subunit ribosomal protein L9